MGDNGTMVFLATIPVMLETTAYGDGTDDVISTGLGDDIILAGDGADTVTTTGGNNIILGDNGRMEFVDGLLVHIRSTAFRTGGNDTIQTGLGLDIIIGGIGNDWISSPGGNNIILGDNGELLHEPFDGLGHLNLIRTLDPAGGGNDTITMGPGNDIVMAGFGADTVSTTAGDNVILGDNGQMRFWQGLVVSLESTDPALGGDDRIATGPGHDLIVGGYGSDVIHAGQGDNVIMGDNGRVDFDPFQIRFVTTTDPTIGGHDVITAGSGNDLVQGGLGDDVITLAGGHNIVLGDHGEIELSNGLPVWITITDPNAGGDDTITTGAGNDIILGGTGSDWIETSAGNNLIFGDHGQLTGLIDQRLLPLAQADKPFTWVSIHTGLADGGAADVIFGGTGQDVIIGGQGDDVIFGRAGDDDIIGGHNLHGGAAGNNIIDGGPGNNVILGDNGSILRRPDTLSPLIRTLTGDTLYLLPGMPGFDPNYPAGVTAASQPHPLGVAGRDIVLFDHHHDQTAAWMFGNDIIAGGAGHDLIFGQLGDDILHGDGWIEVVFDANRRVVSVTLHESLDPTTDGHDYIEGGGGDDLIMGGLGQDDLVGGSSNLFGLTDARQRPDGSDMIFGGNAVTLWRYQGLYYWQGNLPAVPAAALELVYVASGNTIALGHQDDPANPDRHARDADVILGDNGNIYRIVGADGQFLAFNYDALDPTRGELRVIPRAFDLLDYVPGLGDPSADGIHGGGDILYGEDGDDIIHGMTGNDVIHGGAGDDDLYGGTGHDWISGGAGDDGILGDDGKLFTNRITALYGEPLHGIAPTDPAIINLRVSGGNGASMVLDIEGRLRKTADLQPVDQGGHDIIYGGRGHDFLFGGAGDDAISGAEPLARSATSIQLQVFLYLVDDPHGIRANLDHPLHDEFGPLDLGRYRPGQFALYDPFDRQRKVMVDPANGWLHKGVIEPEAIDFLLNFDAFLKDGNRQAVLDANERPIFFDHGDDTIFGGVGNDWIVAGTGSNQLHGDRGDNLINVTNNPDNNVGLNNAPDLFGFVRPDMVFAADGRDIIVGNYLVDRTVDWGQDAPPYLAPITAFESPSHGTSGGSGSSSAAPSQPQQQLMSPRPTLTIEAPGEDSEEEPSVSEALRPSSPKGTPGGKLDPADRDQAPRQQEDATERPGRDPRATQSPSQGQATGEDAPADETVGEGGSTPPDINAPRPEPEGSTLDDAEAEPEGESPVPLPEAGPSPVPPTEDSDDEPTDRPPSV
jgi:Ca2+-binding RTX toxin-like protein